jgi:hypothetical protein
MLLLVGVTTACSPKVPLSRATDTVGSPASTPAEMAVPIPTCREIWADTSTYLYQVPQQIVAGSDTFLAYRVKDFRAAQPGPSRKWVGAFKNVSHKVVDPFPDNADAGHTLGVDEKACLSMKSVFTLKARFEKENGTTAKVRGLFCGGGATHGDSALPEWKDNLQQCGNRVQMSIAVEGGDAGFTLGSDSLSISQLLEKTRAAGAGRIAQSMLLALQQVLGTKGTWFPCSSNGCCRAF